MPVKYTYSAEPYSKVHGDNMGPIWGQQSKVIHMLAPWTLLSGEVSGACDWFA